MEKPSNRPVYIANMGIISAIGDQAKLVYLAAKAGISSYKTASYFTSDHQNMILAEVPDDALPDLPEQLNLSGKLGFRDKRLLQMSLVAAGDAMHGYSGSEPVPLIFSAPEKYAGFDNSLYRSFFNDFCEQSGIPIDKNKTRVICTGRPGVIDALKLAQQYLYEDNHSHVLIGGADSCHYSEFLAFLDTDKRVKTRAVNPKQVEDSFTPGEGAGFILLTRNPLQAVATEQHRIRIESPGFGYESGHLYSQYPYKGEGLDQAIKQALANRQDENTPIELIYSSMNGEHYWSKEMGVALTRSQENFSEQLTIEHPAENYGDIGAATAAGLIVLAHSRLLQERLHSGLVCSSADQGFRAAVCLTLESIPA